MGGVTLLPEPEIKATKANRWHVSSSSLLKRFKAAREAEQAVEANEDSVNLRIEEMETGRFYFAELDGEPYLYRKISEHEIEVYGLAEQA